ncbi:MAG TPA: hypothetical protein VES89_13950 [Candidatus Competibacteraceae bacterium]|nr:hypothetical protein [Candidatus Competibacteraceae bacterium]
MTTEQQTEAIEQSEPGTEEETPLQTRREFLLSLGKWSKAVIAGAVLGGALSQSVPDAQAGWLNRRGYGGGGWINGGGGGWVNRRGYGGGSWINGGGGWVNRGGSWYNRY